VVEEGLLRRVEGGLDWRRERRGEVEEGGEERVEA